MKWEPQRTCVGCRQVRPRAQLLRLVRRADALVVIDRASTAPGRGAYVCPAAECVGEALKRGRLAKAFRERAEASVELVALCDSLRNGARRG
ncbi:MAG: YlxR family protein [Candidatus Rokuibacteriota bacterium]